MIELRKLLNSLIDDKNIRIYLFGSRARGDQSTGSDVDIGLWSDEEIDDKKLALWRAIIEETTIPYQVDLINLRQVSEDFRREIFKAAQLWND
jgi:predicted nucleotidyltransferase